MAHSTLTGYTTLLFQCCVAKLISRGSPSTTRGVHYPSHPTPMIKYTSLPIQHSVKSRLRCREAMPVSLGGPSNPDEEHHSFHRTLTCSNREASGRWDGPLTRPGTLNQHSRGPRVCPSNTHEVHQSSMLSSHADISRPHKRRRSASLRCCKATPIYLAFTSNAHDIH